MYCDSLLLSFPAELMQLQMSVSGMLNELDQMQQDSEGLPRELPVVVVLGECWKDSARNKDYHSQAVSAHRVLRPVRAQWGEKVWVSVHNQHLMLAVLVGDGAWS